MLKQLINEWKEQADLNQGVRGHVFALCADQLEEVLKMEKENSAEKETKGIFKSLSHGAFGHEAELRGAVISEDEEF